MAIDGGNQAAAVDSDGAADSQRCMVGEAGARTNVQGLEVGGIVEPELAVVEAEVGEARILVEIQVLIGHDLAQFDGADDLTVVTDEHAGANGVGSHQFGKIANLKDVEQVEAAVAATGGDRREALTRRGEELGGAVVVDAHGLVARDDDVDAGEAVGEAAALNDRAGAGSVGGRVAAQGRQGRVFGADAAGALVGDNELAERPLLGAVVNGASAHASGDATG